MSKCNEIRKIESKIEKLTKAIKDLRKEFRSFSKMGDPARMRTEIDEMLNVKNVEEREEAIQSFIKKYDSPDLRSLQAKVELLGCWIQTKFLNEEKGEENRFRHMDFSLN